MMVLIKNQVVGTPLHRGTARRLQQESHRKWVRVRQKSKSMCLLPNSQKATTVLTRAGRHQSRQLQSKGLFDLTTERQQHGLTVNKSSSCGALPTVLGQPN